MTTPSKEISTMKKTKSFFFHICIFYNYTKPILKIKLLRSILTLTIRGEVIILLGMYFCYKNPTDVSSNLRSKKYY